MAIDTQNNLNFNYKPFNDKLAVKPNVVSAPPQAPQPVDNEKEGKSNAAKWMIGLTATAAVVIGGLWAAREGHFGESTQKSVKKLLGEATDAVSNTKKETSTTNKTPEPEPKKTSSGTDEPEPIKTGSDVDEVEPKPLDTNPPESKNTDLETGSEEQDIITGNKDPEVISSKEDTKVEDTPKPQNNSTEEVITIKDETSNIEQPINSEKGQPATSATPEVPLNRQTKKFKIGDDDAEHIIETNEKGEVVNEVIKLRAITDTLTLQLERQGDYFVPTKGSYWDITDYLKIYYDNLPEELKSIRVFNKDYGYYCTPRASKWHTTHFDDITEDVPAIEFVELNYSHSDKNFERALTEIDLIKKFLAKYKEIKHRGCSVPSPYHIIDKIDMSQEIKVSDFLADKSEKFVQLFRENFGDIETITHNEDFSSSALITNVLNKLL